MGTRRAVTLDGTPVTGPRPEIGIVFQEANLLPWRNLIDNIHFPFEIKGLRPETPWIEHLLERVGLRGFERPLRQALGDGFTYNILFLCFTLAMLVATYLFLQRLIR